MVCAVIRSPLFWHTFTDISGNISSSAFLTLSRDLPLSPPFVRDTANIRVLACRVGRTDGFSAAGSRITSWFAVLRSFARGRRHCRVPHLPSSVPFAWFFRFRSALRRWLPYPCAHAVQTCGYRGIVALPFCRTVTWLPQDCLHRPLPAASSLRTQAAMPGRTPPGRAVSPTFLDHCCHSLAALRDAGTFGWRGYRFTPFNAPPFTALRHYNAPALLFRTDNVPTTCCCYPTTQPFPPFVNPRCLVLLPPALPHWHLVHRPSQLLLLSAVWFYRLHTRVVHGIQPFCANIICWCFQIFWLCLVAAKLRCCTCTAVRLCTLFCLYVTTMPPH